ncbi:mechanosensitive ion channel family protein [Panacagrimonas sp.]|uniref:mechanosensitive ion channel family protein n=1 Tax=Panacagrimonas sp. TaxID=2480088 RepID=UPI003B522FE6
MDPLTSALDALRLRASELGMLLAERVPDLLAALLLVIVGWLVARLARATIRGLGTRLNRGLEQWLRSERALRLRLSPAMLRLIGTAAFWIILLLFLTLATDIAGMEGVAEWLREVLRYLPTLLFGVMIIVAGHLIGLLVRDLLLEALASAQVEQRELVARLAQTATFLTALIIGVHQVGVNISFVTLVIAVALGSVLLAFSLAFGLGARTLVANLVGTHYLRRQFQPGVRVRVGDIEGEILEITPTNVVVETDEGRAHIPARRFAEDVAVLLTGERDDG